MDTRPFRKLDDLSRRRFLSGAARTFLGVGLLPGSLASLHAAAGDVKVAPRQTPAKNLIYLYMSGGMSHLDTFDTKPEASPEYRGELTTLKTSADGVRVSQYLPNMAQHMDKAVVINSLSSTTGAHAEAAYLMRTSYKKRGTIKHPHLGAWNVKFNGRINQTLPGFVTVNSGSNAVGRGFFEPEFEPLAIGKPDSGLQYSSHYGNISEETFAHRRDLASALDSGFQQRYADRGVQAYTAMYDEAVKLMRSSDLEAFNLGKETQQTRDSYGEHAFGQGCLLARRLVESGIRSVEVQLGGWDTHTENFARVEENATVLDEAMAALIGDLDARGLLKDTMVVLATEFGRTPKINQNAGRDHYPKAFSCVIAGGGVKGGQIHGKTDPNGTEVIENALSIEDFNATVAHGLGLPLDTILYSPSKRPFTVAHKGAPLTDIFA